MQVIYAIFSFERASRIFLLLALILLPVFVSGQRPAPPEHPVTIEHDGYNRTFEIARDEIKFDGVVEHLTTAQPTTKALQEYAIKKAETRDQPAALILYEVGRPRTEQTRRILTSEVLVRLVKGADPATIAHEVHAVSVRTPDFAREYAIFLAVDALGDSLELADRLRAHRDVISADPLLARQRFKRYIPNDPLFNDQWHLRNTGQGGGTAGIDIRVTNVWAQGYFGEGIIIGIVDDGVQYSHPDLSPNYAAAYSRNWNGAPGGPFDPAPTTGGSWPDDHGTPCAGLTSARGNNNEGVSGVAPRSQFSGLRLIAGSVSDSQEAESVAYSNQHLFVKSNSWGPFDAVDNLEAPGPLTRAALSNSTVTGRSGRGTIHVWAGGNGLEQNDNSNYDGYANSIYTIAIAAVNNHGQQSWFSEPGANLVVTAPSDGGSRGIVTTSLMGQGDVLGNNNYEQTFGGTSAATPIVAGVIALMLEANPNLGWRDVQEILISTARQVDSADADWSTNEAGFTFNHKYGAGLVDANAAVTAAQGWSNLGPHLRHATNRTGLNIAIPDNNPAGIIQSFPISQNLRVEHVTVTVGIQHPYRGDLQITLTSPSGMTSTLAERRNDGNANYNQWTFMTVRNWGEDISGTWELHIADLAPADVGTLNSVRLDFFGTDTEPPASGQPPILQAIGPRSTIVNQPLSFVVTATDDADNDEITLTASNVPPWASFAPAIAATSVSQTFNGTPTTTGTWFTTFHATDKDGTASETVQISVHPFIASNLVVVMDEGFDSGLPAGWSVATNGHPSAYWRFDNPAGRTNYVGGSDPFVIADSDHAGSVDMDTSLQTPALNLRTLSVVFLEFNSDFYLYEQATGDVDISTNGLAGPWINVWRQTTDRWGTKEVLDLSAHVAGQPNVAIRFRYHNANYDWWWQIDDVKVYGYEIDSDGDGIPDAWEIYYFGDLETANATSDFSGNNFSDLHAFLAGTDPRDPNSALQFEQGRVMPDGTVRIQWQSAPDRHYRIDRSTNLYSFTTIQDNIPATPPLNTFDDETATPHPVYFYRIMLDHPNP